MNTMALSIAIAALIIAGNSWWRTEQAHRRINELAIVVSAYIVELPSLPQEESEMTTTTNTTALLGQGASDVAALWQAWQETEEELLAWCKSADLSLEVTDAPAWPRQEALEEAIIAARPADPLGMAAQLEWAAHAIDEGGRGDEPEILRAMAQSLKELGAGALS